MPVNHNNASAWFSIVVLTRGADTVLSGQSVLDHRHPGLGVNGSLTADAGVDANS
jgi:hypothetical protein